MTRIVSFLPAGTEIAFAVGAGPMVVGRSHECDFPAEVTAIPVVSRPALELDGLSQAQIDSAVSRKLHEGGSLYTVDEVLLRELSPDVILTQDLCQVCAPSGNELTRAIAELPTQPEIVWLTPHTVEEIHQNLVAVGQVTGRSAAAQALVRDSLARLARVERMTAALAPVRTVFLEWVEPYFSAGHWVPQMIEMAGGSDPLGTTAADSRRITWDEVTDSAPEVIIVAPCGYGLERAADLAGQLPDAGRASVYAVDANAYFARPGPRVAEGVELLASIFHPEAFDEPPAHKGVRVR